MPGCAFRRRRRRRSLPFLDPVFVGGTMAMSPNQYNTGTLIQKVMAPYKAQLGLWSLCHCITWLLSLLMPWPCGILWVSPLYSSTRSNGVI